jgi:flagellar hook-associated protein 1 FlgK
MGLSTALGAALSGLKASQAGLDLVAANIANSRTAGYTKKTLATEAAVVGGSVVGVRSDEIRRELDLYLQRQLRTEAAGASYASTRAAFLDRLQESLGTPGGKLSLDTVVAEFGTALDALAASPDDFSARGEALQQAQILAQTLNAASRDVQELRAQADAGLADGVEKANEALRSIEQITDQIVNARAKGETTANLLDQRDQAIDTLASLMDIRVEDLGAGEIRVKTQSGLSLYDGSASVLEFQPSATVAPETAYSADPAERSLGTIALKRPSGYSIDLLAEGQLRSGEFRALADLRDKALPQAQTQLDELAANLAQALGTKTVPGASVAGGVALSTAGAARGDRLTVAYETGGVSRSLTIVNVGDSSRLPLPDSLTADPNDRVIGIDFTSPTAAADLDAALAAAGIAIDATGSGSGFALTSGAAGLTVTGGSSRITATALSGDGLALPVFVDQSGGVPYSGSLDGGDQRTGFAGRIGVNPALLADPAKLTSYASGAASGDGARAEFLRDALDSDRPFSVDAGLGAASQPFTGSIGDFARGVIDTQARASASATRVADGQSLVMSSLTDRYSSASGVDVDEEMGRLIQLQTAYGANARVITAVREMLDMLMNV